MNLGENYYCFHDIGLHISRLHCDRTGLGMKSASTALTPPLFPPLKKPLDCNCSSLTSTTDWGCTGQLPGVNVCHCVSVTRAFLRMESLALS